LNVLRTALNNVWARKRRLVGTTLAVVLGVTFLTATLVLGDSARAGFDVAFTEANADTDALVRSSDRLTGAEEPVGAPLDASIVDLVRSVDGVDQVAAAVEGTAQILGSDGSPLGGNGPPTVGAAWIDDPSLSPYALADGRPPTRPGEVVIDRGSAEKGELHVGSTTSVLVPSPVPVTVVGIATFGGRDSLGGVTLAAFTLPDAQRLMLGGAPQVTGVVVGAREGVSQEELVARVAAVLPTGVEAISGSDLTAEQRAAIESDFLGFLETALLVFSAVALIVAGFSIFNTFSVLSAQRTRESALLRSLGASRRQLLGVGLVEAALLGLAGSVLGAGAGVLVARGVQAALDAGGFGLPTSGVRVGPASLVIAAAAGVLLTLLGAVVPAWRASRVPPLAALRAADVDSTSTSRLRVLAGAALGAAGVALVVSGTGGSGSMPRAGLGALVVVVAFVVAGPALAKPVVRALATPLSWRGVAGDLAVRNALRNPRRTSATSAALLVGVGVVTLFTVFGASVSASIEAAVDRSFGGDLVVRSSGFSGAGLSSTLIDDMRGLPEIDAVAALGFGAVRLDGEDRSVGYADLAGLGSVASFDVTEGDMASVGAGRFAISSETAEEEGWALGRPVAVTFPDGATEELTVAAIYDDRALGGDVLLPAQVWSAHAPQTSYALALLGVRDGTGLAAGRRAVEAVTVRHGNLQVHDRDEFVESQAAEIDALLTVIYGLLAVAIVIALIGIGNTLSLSVHERTRELGLLRAVGQTRTQLRSMVRWESVIVATFGTVSGLAAGVFLGWGLVRALAAAEGLGTFAFPAGSLLVVLAMGAAVGVVAGLRPAWRASRMDVLAAVSAS
jgi:putative ABC transport system permease protein